MNEKILVSLCIPTNGIAEWVEKVVESIYRQNINEKEFEVIITDNGNSNDCQDIIKKKYFNHGNLVYKRTSVNSFLNQLEAMRLAKGSLIKFVNHRAVLCEGTLDYLLNISRFYEKKTDRPIIYFSNGNKMLKRGEYKNFDEFVNALSYFSSYSGGLSCWKDDFQELDGKADYNELFPHMGILFYFKNRKYIIDGSQLFEMVPCSHQNKGTYNLFWAFGVEYIVILLNLLKHNDISFETFKSIKESNKKFLIDSYADFVLLKAPHSYQLDDYKEYLDIFYNFKEIEVRAMFSAVKIRIYKCINKEK